MGACECAHDNVSSFSIYKCKTKKAHSTDLLIRRGYPHSLGSTAWNVKKRDNCTTSMQNILILIWASNLYHLSEVNRCGHHFSMLSTHYVFNVVVLTIRRFNRNRIILGNNLTWVNVSFAVTAVISQKTEGSCWQGRHMPLCSIAIFLFQDQKPLAW